MNEYFENIKPKDLEPIPKERKFFEMEMTKVKLPAKPGISFGVDETIDVLDFAIKFANAVISALADGKITVGDLPGFIIPMTKLPKAISGIEFVPYEINDLSPDELEKLKTFVLENLEVDDEQAKLIVKQSIITLYEIYNLVKLIKGPELPIDK